MSDVRWTNKLPSLLAGLIILAAALLAKGRRLTLTAIILAMLGAAFVGYSLTIKDWCELRGASWGQSAFGQGGFGGGFGSCLRMKGWLSF